jgi:Putative phage tail protein
MITITVMANPLRPTSRTVEHVSAPLRLDTWLMQRWPAGVKGTLAVVINGEPTPLEECERRILVDGDHLLLVVTPAAFAVPFIVNAIIGMMVAGVMSILFAKKPKAQADSAPPSPVYSVSGAQNAARLGEPIPVGYGEFVQVPDFGSQPYTEFVFNEMYLCQILVIGQGEYDVLEMLVGESQVDGLPAGVVAWDVFGPARHLQRMGQIEDSGLAPVMENVVTSPEVGDQELLPDLDDGAIILPTIYWQAFNSYSYVAPDGPGPPGTGTEQTQAWLQAHGTETVGTLAWYTYTTTVEDVVLTTWTTYVQVIATAYAAGPYPAGSIIPDPTEGPLVAQFTGWFDACKPGAVGDLCMLDFVFGAGLYATDGSGNLTTTTVQVAAEFVAIDDEGNETAAPITQTYSYTAAANFTQRFTEYKTLPAARYRVRCKRVTAGATEPTVMDRVTWAGLKLKLVRAPDTQVVYGTTTLVAVRIKASNGIASSATSRIRFRVRRRLPILGTGLAVWDGYEANPADAFIDVLTAANYGAMRPLDEVDMPALNACHIAWAGTNGFNAVFAQRSTVFEALCMCTQVVAAGPLPVGQVMSVEVDSVKPDRVAMFNEANLTNLVVAYEFDKDGAPAGVRVEYRRPHSFDPGFIVLPEGETDVEGVSLFGCSDEETAGQYAQLVMNRRALQRKSISFDTEQEGLMLLPGDRIAVQHQMPRWGQVAIVDDTETPPAPVPDPTTLLLHADGADASTTFTDTSLNAATMTRGGDAQLDTAQKVFGTASMLFDGIGDYIETPVHARYDLGAISAATKATWRFRARWIVGGPVYTFGNVKLLIHASTRPFVDVSTATKPVANLYGKCGISGGKVTFSDTSAGLVVRGSDSDWKFGTGAWFISARVSAGTYASAVNIFDSRPSAGSSSGFLMQVDTSRRPLMVIEGTTYGTGTPAANLLAGSSVESTISFSYDGTSLRCFVDGALSWTQTVSLNIDTGGFLVIGNVALSQVAGTSANTSATLQDLFIVKGEAVAIAAFTVPASWTDSGNAIATWNPATYSNVKLNCHMAGTNGGTTFTDNSAGAKTITRNGNTQTSTAQARIGSSSGLFDGTGDYLTVPDSADWDFGTGEFYVQAQIRPANITVRQIVISNYLDSSTGWTEQINLTSNGRWHVNFTGDGSEWDSNTPTGGSYLPIVANAWQEIGFGRMSVGGVTFICAFYEGELVFIATDSQNIAGSTQALYVGRLSTISSTVDFNGYMQELRVVKAECPGRSYTVDTAAHPNS